MSTPSPRTVFQDVRVFDGERILQRACVIVEGGTVASVLEGGAVVAARPGDECVAGDEIVAGEDLTLLPGLIDAHTHTWHDFVLADALRFGVTTTIDMLTPVEVADRLRKEQQQGPVYHRADLVSAGNAATAPGGHGTDAGRMVPTLSRPGQARLFVKQRVEEGSDFIKIIIEPGIGRRKPIPTLDASVVRALVDAAHDCGRIAVVHALSLAGAVEAIRAGADGLAHSIIEGEPGEDVFDEACRRGVFLIATLTALEGALGMDEGSKLAANPLLSPHLSEFWLGNLAAGGGASRLPARYEVARRFVGRAIERGIAVLAGTDTPNPGTAAGASLHRELELLVKCGQEPMEALRAATSRPADTFGLASRGRIQAGSRADLLLVRGDPTRNILFTRHIDGVWKHGRPLPVGRCAKTNSS